MEYGRSHGDQSSTLYLVVPYLSFGRLFSRRLRRFSFFLRLSRRCFRRLPRLSPLSVASFRPFCFRHFLPPRPALGLSTVVESLSESPAWATWSPFGWPWWFSSVPLDWSLLQVPRSLTRTLMPLWQAAIFMWQRDMYVLPSVPQTARIFRRFLHELGLSQLRVPDKGVADPARQDPLRATLILAALLHAATRRWQRDGYVTPSEPQTGRRWRERLLQMKMPGQVQSGKPCTFSMHTLNLGHFTFRHALPETHSRLLPLHTIISP